MRFEKNTDLKKISRRVLLASVPVFAMLGHPASAADLRQIFDTQSAYDWNGLYAGLQFGWGVGTVESSSGGVKISEDFNSGDGTSGGVLFGWNVQNGDIVYGLEAGLSINEIKSTHNGSKLAYHTSDYVWNAEARARMGYAAGRFLPYIAGGVVLGEFYQQSRTGGTGPSAEMNTVWGYTAGAGVDVRVTNNVTFRSEYVYQNFGKENYTLASVPTTLSSQFDFHMARAAVLYHFGNPITRSNPATSNALLFAGPSLGLNIGGSFGEVSLSNYSSGSADLNSFTGGVNVGYLYPINDFRVGAEAELAFHGGDTSLTPTGPLTDFDYRLMWHASIRGKVGYVYDRFMPYVMGGVNLGQITTSSQPSNNTNLDPYKSAWSVGGGVEYAFTNTMSADVAYSFNRFNGVDVETNGGTTKPALDAHHVRVGLVFRGK